MSHCYAADCNHVRPRELCRMYRFPKQKDVWDTWKIVCRREDRDPTDNDRLCSCHFLNGEKRNGPTIFNYNNKKQFEFESSKYTTWKSCSAVVNNVGEPSGTRKMYNSFEYHPSESISTSTSDQSSFSREGLVSNQDLNFLKKEIDELKAKLQNGEHRMSIEHIKENSSLVYKYTGLPNASHFFVIVKLLKRFEIMYVSKWNDEKISLEDQLLCTLMKLRLHLPIFDLAYRFKVPPSTVSNIVQTFVCVIHKVMFVGMMNKIPSREKNKLVLPACFTSFPHTRIVLDCTEIKVAVSPSMLNAADLHKKSQLSFKVLLGIAPNSAITYVSDLFPGSMSDTEITRVSKVLNHMVAGDTILCDEEFRINDLCQPLDVKVNQPAFLLNSELSKEEELESKKVTCALVHVGHVVERLKGFKILDCITPSFGPHSSKVVQVCAVLVNLQYSMLTENEQCLQSNDLDMD